MVSHENEDLGRSQDMQDLVSKATLMSLSEVRKKFTQEYEDILTKTCPVPRPPSQAGS
ncbi:hypothetical protein LEMLEM_LOCUS315, partial [Lemmus lemmus]